MEFIESHIILELFLFLSQSVQSPIQSTEAIAQIVERLARLIPAAGERTGPLLSALGSGVSAEAFAICSARNGGMGNPNAEWRVGAIEKVVQRVANLLVQ